MKRLILVRHGKSSWEHDLTDRHRPLKKRGFNDGVLVAEEFANNFKSPQIMWTSDAVRAHTTANIFKDTLNFSDSNFDVKSTLYTFDDRQLTHIIKGCEDSVSSLMVFGHNHAMTLVANTLGSQFIENVPTTGLVIIDFDVKRWTQIKNGTTVKTIFPKDLK